jgi:23S rRNA (guanosine2251-2'-O)-methyltransferase
MTKPISLTEENDITAGARPVQELVASGAEIEKLYIRNDLKSRYAAIISKCHAAQVIFADGKTLDKMSGSVNNQGIVAVAAQIKYAEVGDMLALADKRGQSALIVIAAGVEDPRNLGAIIRCADGAGAHGVIIPKRGAAGINSAVMKTSAGAARHVPIARVPNIPAVME